MIFFRKKKPAPPEQKPAPVKKSAPEPLPQKSFQEIVHNRVLTAEGWRRQMKKKAIKKPK